jgi:hypothetical protein
MTEADAEALDAVRQERTSRVRVGATGLAVIIVIVLLAATFSGTASNEPELTPEALAEQGANDAGSDGLPEGEPQEPLAELGVAPATSSAQIPFEADTEEPESADEAE